MKSKYPVSFVLFPLALLNSAAYAVCAPGSDWTASWTDSFNQTTYTLVAPCKVYIGIPFNITATVTDSTFPDNDVAFGWSIIDNGTTIAGGGFNWLATVGGQWQTVITQTYSGTPVDHSIEFQFSDLGEGSGAHWWKTGLIGDITVDPYPPGANHPPVADAGPDLLIEGRDQAATVVAGVASDEDGDALSYRWLENETELQPSRAVDQAGNAPLNLAELPALAIGSHTLTLEVSDGSAVATDTVVVAVENSKPTVASAVGGTFRAGEDIPLTGSVADYDGDTLSYRWLEGEIMLAQGTIETSPGGAPVALSEHLIAGGLQPGDHTIVLEASDGINIATQSTSLVVTDSDTEAPTLAPTASRYILFPPDGRMARVTIDANAKDESANPITLAVAVDVNQPPRRNRRGNLIPDYRIVDIDQANGTIVLELRKAKGHEAERIYTVTITASDQAGNSSSSHLEIKAVNRKKSRRVHHKRSK